MVLDDDEARRWASCGCAEESQRVVVCGCELAMSRDSGGRWVLGTLIPRSYPAHTTLTPRSGNVVDR
jgi:hypothetical protein